MNVTELSWKHIALVGIGVVAVLGALWEFKAWSEEQEARALFQQVEQQIAVREKSFDDARADNEKEAAVMAKKMQTLQAHFHDDFEKSWNEAHKIRENLDKRYQR